MDLPANTAELWHTALRRWGLGVDLSAPVVLRGAEALAYIDLRSRQTHVNVERLQDLSLSWALPTFLAHEAGHHVRYPQTLVMAAKLQLRQRRLLEDLEMARPGLPRVGAGFKAERYDSLLNLFLDVCINDALRSEGGDDFPGIYRRLQSAENPEPPSTIFAFTMALYDALWDLGTGAICGERERVCLAEVSADFAQEARALADRLRAAAGNLFLGLDLYLEACWPYLVADARRAPTAPPSIRGLTEAPLARDLGDLDPDELREVVRRSLAEAEADDAREGRLHPALVELPPDETQPGEMARGELDDGELERVLAAGRQCGGRAADASIVVRAIYQRLAEQLDVQLPESPRVEPLTPTTLEAWEPGEDTQAIDWGASLGRGGIPIPGLTLLRREAEDESVGLGPGPVPWVEIYIDSSGSMPNPAQRFSPLCFAGFLLSRAALSAGGLVRLVQYSGPGDVRAMPEFGADPAVIAQALLQYYGAGTAFPFGTLRASLERFRSFSRIERVVLSDTDFLYNLAHPQAGDPAPLPLLGEAARPPHGFTAILNLGGLSPASQSKLVPAGLAATGIRCLPIREWNQLHGVAAALGQEIFGKRS